MTKPKPMPRNLSTNREGRTFKCGGKIKKSS